MPGIGRTTKQAFGVKIHRSFPKHKNSTISGTSWAMHEMVRGLLSLHGSLGELFEALLAERARSPVDIDAA